MTYNISESYTGPYLVYFSANSTSVSANSPIPYTLQTGTSGHGITVSGGTVTLPQGEWICYASADPNSIQSPFEARWAVNGSYAGGNNFPKLISKGFNQNPFYSEMTTTAIISKGGETISLNPTTTVTISYVCDMVIFGVRT